MRIFREVKLSDEEEDNVWATYERVRSGLMEKGTALKLFESVLSQKVKRLQPEPAERNVDVRDLADQLFDFVHASSSDDVDFSETNANEEKTMYLTSREISRREVDAFGEQTRMNRRESDGDELGVHEDGRGSDDPINIPFGSSFRKTTTTTKNVNGVLPDKRYDTVEEELRVECARHRRVAQHYEARYKTYRTSQEQRTIAIESRSEAFETQITALRGREIETHNHMEHLESELEEARRSRSRLMKSIDECETTISREASEISDLREHLRVKSGTARTMSIRLKKEQAAAKRWMSQRQIALISAKATESKCQRYEEAARTAREEIRTFESQYQDVLQESTEYYDQFVESSHAEAKMAQENHDLSTTIDSEIEMVKAHSERMHSESQEIVALQRELQIARDDLSKASVVDVEASSTKMDDDDTQNALTDRIEELRSRLEQVRSTSDSEMKAIRTELESARESAQQFEIDAEKAKDDFEELWKELVTSREIVAALSDQLSAQDDEKNQDATLNDSSALTNAAHPHVGPLLAQLKSLSKDLDEAKTRVRESPARGHDMQHLDDETHHPPPVPHTSPFSENDVTSSSPSTTMTRSMAMLRSELNAERETTAKQKAALLALQSTLKLEMVMASSKASHVNDDGGDREENDDDLVGRVKEQAMATERALRGNLQYANGEVVALHMRLGSLNKDLDRAKRERAVQIETNDAIRRVLGASPGSDLTEMTEVMMSRVDDFKLQCMGARAEMSRLEEQLAATEESRDIARAEHEESRNAQTELSNHQRALRLSIEEIVTRDDQLLQEQKTIASLRYEVNEVRDALCIVASTSDGQAVFARHGVSLTPPPVPAYSSSHSEKKTDDTRVKSLRSRFRARHKKRKAQATRGEDRETYVSGVLGSLHVRSPR